MDRPVGWLMMDADERQYIVFSDPRDPDAEPVYLRPAPVALPGEPVWRCSSPPCKCDESNYKYCAYANYAASVAPALDTQSAKEKYDKCMEDVNEPDPIERLRFFCSLALNRQDWIDVEPFFDALLKTDAQMVSVPRARAEEISMLLEEVSKVIEKLPDNKWELFKARDFLADELFGSHLMINDWLAAAPNAAAQDTALKREEGIARVDEQRSATPVSAAPTHKVISREPIMPGFERVTIEEIPAPVVVITRNQDNECVAVTRQDAEGHVLEVLWERPEVERDEVLRMEGFEQAAIYLESVICFQSAAEIRGELMRRRMACNAAIAQEESK